jgi:hypothetical protein
VFVEPVAQVGSDCAPGSVLGAETTGGRDVRPPQSSFRLRQGLAEEGESSAPAVTDGRLRNDYGHGEEAISLLEEAADIQPIVVRGTELRDLIGPFGLASDVRLRQGQRGIKCGEQQESQQQERWFVGPASHTATVSK